MILHPSCRFVARACWC